MKKRISKILVVVAVLTVLFSIPVFAQEVTDPTKVYTVKAFDADESILINDFHKGEVWRCENYIEYLDGVIYNLNETVRIKKEIVDNYIYLSQFNPAFRDLIPQAQADYEKAVAWVEFYKAYKVNARNDLKARYNY